MEVVFEPEEHRYFIDGEEVPSVSAIVDVMNNFMYKDSDVPEYYKELAAERGTIVHECTEKLDKGGDCDVDAEYVGYVNGYVQFIADKRPKWEFIEEIVTGHDLIDKEMKYAGRIDRYGEMDGKKVLLDIKTCKSINKQKRAVYQTTLNLYRIALLESEGIDLEEIYLLQLFEDGTYKLIKCEIDTSLPTACLSIYKALTPKKRKKVE